VKKKEEEKEMKMKK